MRCSVEREAAQHGAVLIAVLILSLVFTTLSLALLAGAESSLEAQENARGMDRAESAAISGVEAVIARVDTLGAAPFADVLQVGSTAVARVAFDPDATPSITSIGRVAGIESSARAHLGVHYDTLISLRGTGDFNHAVNITGDVYLGDLLDGLTVRFDKPGCLLTGNLYLASAVAQPTTEVAITGGAQTTLVSAIADPAFDTARFLSMTSGGVTVHQYRGGTSLIDMVIDGIVVCSLAKGDAVRLKNTTIHGTVVLHYVPTLATNLGEVTFEMDDNSVIDGGTAWTGNLALLAPTAGFKADRGIRKSLTGVTYVGSVTMIDSTTIRGMFVCRTAVFCDQNVFFDQAAGWRADVPIGFVPPSRMRLTWYPPN